MASRVYQRNDTDNVLLLQKSLLNKAYPFAVKLWYRLNAKEQDNLIQKLVIPKMRKSGYIEGFSMYCASKSNSKITAKLWPYLTNIEKSLVLSKMPNSANFLKNFTKYLKVHVKGTNKKSLLKSHYEIIDSNKISAKNIEKLILITSMLDTSTNKVKNINNRAPSTANSLAVKGYGEKVVALEMAFLYRDLYKSILQEKNRLAILDKAKHKINDFIEFLMQNTCRIDHGIIKSIGEKLVSLASEELDKYHNKEPDKFQTGWQNMYAKAYRVLWPNASFNKARSILKNFSKSILSDSSPKSGRVACEYQNKIRLLKSLLLKGKKQEARVLFLLLRAKNKEPIKQLNETNFRLLLQNCDDKMYLKIVFGVDKLDIRSFEELTSYYDNSYYQKIIKKYSSLKINIKAKVERLSKDFLSAEKMGTISKISVDKKKKLYKRYSA